MPHTLLKAKYKHKQGCGCKMCKPWKGKWEDRRTVNEKKKDISYMEQPSEIAS